MKTFCGWGVVDRFLDTVRGQRGEGLLQKRGERLTAHLPGCHGELAVRDAAQAAGMPVDRDVVGRIGEDHAGLLARHQGGEHGSMATRSGMLARIRLRTAVRRQSWRKRVGTPAA